MAQVISIATIVAIGVQRLKATATVAIPATQLKAEVVTDANLPAQLKGLSIVSKISLAGDYSPIPVVYYSTTAVSALVAASNL
jgi:hypothetical protein